MCIKCNGLIKAIALFYFDEICILLANYDSFLQLFFGHQYLKYKNRKHQWECYIAKYP